MNNGIESDVHKIKSYVFGLWALKIAGVAGTLLGSLNRSMAKQSERSGSLFRSLAMQSGGGSNDGLD